MQTGPIGHLKQFNLVLLARLLVGLRLVSEASVRAVPSMLWRISSAYVPRETLEISTVGLSRSDKVPVVVSILAMREAATDWWPSSR